MNEEKARSILGDAIHKDGVTLSCTGHYMAWSPGDKMITLDSEFTLEEVEAIAWWMRNISANI
jgi:hypothetical protein